MLDKEEKKRDEVDPLIVKMGALFEPNSPMRVLNCNIDQFAKTIAALFIIQHQKFKWPDPGFVYGYQGYQQVSKAFSKWTGIPYTKKALPTKSSVLFIGPKPYVGPVHQKWRQAKIQQLTLLSKG